MRMKPPSKKPSPSAWLSDLGAMDDVDVLDHLPPSCDIAIIGAGMTGCALAYHLSEMNPNLDVVCIESRDISGGASGRNGGISWPSSDEPFELETAKEMRLFAEQDGCEVYYHNGGGVSLVELREDSEVVEELEDTLEHVTKIDPVQCLGATAGKFSAAYFDHLVSSFWPAKFVRSLARNSQPSAKYVTHCTVLNFQAMENIQENSGNESTKTIIVNTDLGVIKCNRIVVATNAWIPQLLPELLPHFEARMNTVLCSNSPVVEGNKPRALEEESSNHETVCWENISALSCGDGASELYMSVRHDGRLILGGLRDVNIVNMASSQGNDTQDKEEEEEEEEEEEDVPPGDPQTIQALRAWLYDKFPSIADRCGGFDQTWYGVMGFPSDSQPIVGRVPRKNEKVEKETCESCPSNRLCDSIEGHDGENVFVVSACCGHGMPRCYGLAKILASQLVGADLTEMQQTTFAKFDVQRFF